MDTDIIKPLFQDIDTMKMFQSKQKYACIPNIYKWAFDRYYIRDTDAQRHLYTVATKYIKEAELDTTMLILGNTGIGKTYTACMVLNETMRLFPSFNCKFAFSLTMFDQIRRSYSTHDTKYIDNIVNADVLVIDDLSYEFSQDEIKRLCQIITERSNNGLGSILTANRHNLDFFPTAIKDRLFASAGNYCIQVNASQSFRTNKVDVLPFDKDIDGLEKYLNKDLKKNENVYTQEEINIINEIQNMHFDGITDFSEEFENRIFKKWEKDYKRAHPNFNKEMINFRLDRMVYISKRSDIYKKLKNEYSKANLEK